MLLRYSRITLLLFSIALLSCEDKIHPELQSAKAILVVDGWLNNKPEAQYIILTQTQPYFDNVIPSGVSGALVTVTSNKGNVFTFNEDQINPGRYKWNAPTKSLFGIVGDTYTLNISLNGETFQSKSRMGRVPVIDSLTYDSDKRIGSKDSLTRGQFWSTDPLGPGDAYWIRAYKNKVLLSKPSEINIAYDGGLNPGGDADGVIFITPVRRKINSRDVDDSGKQLSPIVPGDSLNVQIHSITQEAFNYLTQVITQTDRPGGFQELFSRPLANVSTNISNTNKSGSSVVGFFNVSAVSQLGKKYVKKK